MEVYICGLSCCLYYSEINSNYLFLGSLAQTRSVQKLEFPIYFLEAPVTGALVERPLLLCSVVSPLLFYFLLEGLSATMRNEDIAKAMKQMELNFKQHTDAQFATYTKILEQYMSSTDQRFSQLHQQVYDLSKGKAPLTSTLTSQPNKSTTLIMGVRVVAFNKQTWPLTLFHQIWLLLGGCTSFHRLECS